MKSFIEKIISNKLINSSIYYVLGGFLIQGINFFTVPIFTRILSPEDYGIISVYGVWMGIISIFITLQTFGTIANAKVKYEEDEFNEYLSNTLIISLISFLLIGLVFFVFKNQVSALLGLKSSIVFLLLIQSFFNAGITYKITILINYSKAKERLSVAFLLTISNIILSILLIKNVVFLDKYILRIIGGVIPTVILGMYFWGEVLNKKKPTLKKEHFKYCLGLSLPLIFHGLSGVILNSSDRIMLEKFSGMKETGIYSFIYNIGMVVSILWSAFNSAWVPWFYENMKKKNREMIKDYSKKYLYFFTFLCINFTLISPELIKIMGPSYYWGGLEILPWIIMGYYFIFLYSFPVNYEFYFGKTRIMAFATIVAALLNIGLNFYFIPKLGAKGAALTTLVACVFLFLFHEIIVRIKFKDNIINLKDYLKGIFFMVITVAIYYICIDNFLIRLVAVSFIDTFILRYVYKFLEKSS